MQLCFTFTYKHYWTLHIQSVPANNLDQTTSFTSHQLWSEADQWFSPNRGFVVKKVNS